MSKKRGRPPACDAGYGRAIDALYEMFVSPSNPQVIRLRLSAVKRKCDEYAKILLEEEEEKLGANRE